MKTKNFSVTKNAVKFFACMIVGVFFLVAMNTSLAIAQPQGYKHGPNNMTPFLKERLKLSDEQEKKVEAIFEDHENRMKDISCEQYKRRYEERLRSRREIGTARKETEKKIKSVLTEEQMKEYKSLRGKECMGQGQGFRGDGPGRPMHEQGFHGDESGGPMHGQGRR
jgi:Spy/CpxP family protein refolding chaperone